MNKWINKIRKQRNYKRFVGDSDKYNEIGKILFHLMLEFGIKKSHSFLDLGCGALRLGKFLIPYLNKKKYYGIEPEKWLIEESIKRELESETIEKKQPVFSENDNFELTIFKKKFDYILANSIFIHASKKQIENCIKEAALSMRKEGIFIFNFFEDKKDNDNNDWTYPGAIKYTRKYILNLLTIYNFAAAFIKVKYPGNQKWIAARLIERENDK